jgi:O-antigen/teichoic acid export membrane protein
VVVATQLLLLLLAVASTAVLARLLSPSEYGVFFLAVVLLGMVNSFRDFGFTVATLQAEHLDQEALSALFWLNVRLNAVLALVMAGAGPLLGWFFGSDRIPPLIATLSVAVGVNGLATIHLGLLRRQLRFTAVSVITVGATLCGLAVAIPLAAAGAGAWALTAQLAVYYVIEAAAIVSTCRWRPTLRARPSGSTLRELKRFGRDVSLTAAVGHLAHNLGVVVLGRVGDPTAVGLYQKSFRWTAVLSEQFLQPLQGVAVALLSRVRHGGGRYEAHLRATLRIVAAPTFALLAFVLVEADAVVALLLGPQWAGAVPLFRLLILAATARVVGQLVLWVSYTEGRAGRQRQWALVATPPMVVAMVLCVVWGAQGVAAGYATASLALAVPGVRFTLGASAFSPSHFWRALQRPIGAAAGGAIAAGAVTMLGLVPVDGNLARLAGHGAVFATGWTACWLISPGGRAELLGLRATIAGLGWRPPSSGAGRRGR